MQRLMNRMQEAGRLETIVLWFLICTESSGLNKSHFQALRNPGQGKWCHNRHLGYKVIRDKDNKQRDQHGDIVMQEDDMQEDLTESSSDDDDDDNRK
ncbi:hypothetical protein BGZ79_006018 [Entomortierella chlamydospora]|nr:hypothetical protein BGZ79_006018 [Entomortierella chlamydospora]